ncbi:MAG: hypothetical protein CYPHOPRED_001502 [Cyphobasidiales sp. Tagirdzhanova-0007]|nr:MAG: hypothetical protein CYPHOPRED_001502 [Cyphobasidiales sp. Tagirdzhanova-0007]
MSDSEPRASTSGFRRFRAPSTTATSPSGNDRNNDEQAGQVDLPNLPSPLGSEAGFAVRTESYDDILAPLDEVIEGIKSCFACYFQVGFLHEASFLEKLAVDTRSINLFLILALLSMGAPFTKRLSQRYGGKAEAGQRFSKLAQDMMAQHMSPPTLERTQAFFVLGVEQWSKGDGERGWMLIGTAARMAGWLKLHLESSYVLPPNPTFEQVIEKEVARRTFWLMHYHEGHMLTGSQRPASFQLAEIDAFLPMDEDDFAFGQEPNDRASMAGTAIAGRLPITTTTLSRSLFELGYLSVTVVAQLSDVILQRSYLPFMAAAFDPETTTSVPTIDEVEAPAGFWENMTLAMYASADVLMQQIDAYFASCAGEVAGKWEDLLLEIITSTPKRRRNPLQQTAQTDAFLDHRHGFYRPEAATPNDAPSRSSSRPVSRDVHALDESSTSQSDSYLGLTLGQPFPGGPNGADSLTPSFQLSDGSEAEGLSVLDVNTDFDGFFRQLLSADLTDFSVPVFWHHQ